MKVLYVACNPEGAGDLLLENEITSLQARFALQPGEPVQFEVLPNLPIEDLGVALSRHRPEILHISSHGHTNGDLIFANADRQSVALTGECLNAFLNMENRPRLVYLNACNSQPLAHAIVGTVPIAVGTTAEITNRAALAGALLFYDRILTGESIKTAYEAGRAAVKTLNRDSIDSVIYTIDGVDLFSERLYPVPRIIACLCEHKANPDPDGYYEFEIGVWGCPGETSHLVIFTDDLSFVADEDEEDLRDESFLASKLCGVVLSYPVKNVIWSEQADWAMGDYRLFATGVTSGGRTFTTSSTLCQAIDAYFRYLRREEIPHDYLSVIAQLRRLDGSGGPMPPQADAKPTTKRPKTRKGVTKKRVRR